MPSYLNHDISSLLKKRSKMNAELFSYLKIASLNLNPELISANKQDENDFENLKTEIRRVIPDWLKLMLLKFEIANLSIDFLSIEDEILSIQFNGFKQIENACLNMYPGSEIFQLGFIGIAEDPTGSGDPYFIKYDEGDNPPVYQIYHDVSDRVDEILKNGIDLVANKLSDIFKNQIK